MSTDTPAEVIEAAKADPFTQSVLGAGATPAPVDYDALLKNLDLMQKRVAMLEAERGVPADPIAAHVKNLTDHINARSAAVPTIDMSVIKDTLAKLPENSADVTPAHTNYVKELVHALVDKFRANEFDYLRELASNLHLEVLKLAVPSV